VGAELNLDRALQHALQAAQDAAAVIRRYYRQGVQIQHKADFSPVTQADIEAEAAIKAALKSHYPEHGYYGEETQVERLDAEYLWLIDPIDGTKSFVRDYPIFSTQIALMQHQELVLGVSMASEFQQIAFARRGGGAWLADSLDSTQARRITVREPAASDEDSANPWARAIVSTGNVKTLAQGSGWQQLAALAQRAHRLRGYGDFYHYHLLAQGSLDVVLESDVNILDIAALSVIVQEAGGVFTDLCGDAIGLQTRSVLAATPALHAHAKTMFAQDFQSQLAGASQ
jgi:histidinol-phosphatase